MHRYLFQKRGEDNMNHGDYILGIVTGAFSTTVILVIVCIIHESVN